MPSLYKILIIGLTTFGLYAAAGTWTVKTFQNNGGNYGFGNGGANVADFDNAYGIAFDDAGNPFIADGGNHVIRSFNLLFPPNSYSAPAIVAGDDGNAGNLNGNGIAAQFNGPSSLAVRPFSLPPSIFIADLLGGKVREMSLAAPYTVSTSASLTALQDLTPAAYNPQNLVFSDDKTLYVSGDNNKIHKYTDNDSDGVWDLDAEFDAASTIGGLAVFGPDLYYTADNDVYKIDGNLVATNSIANGFLDHFGIVAGPGGLYVADTGNHVIKQLITNDGGATWTVSTIAGTGGTGDTDGDGLTATFEDPTAIAVGPLGLYVTDTTSHTLRLLTFIPAPAPISISLADIPTSAAPPSFAHITAATGESVGRATEATFGVETSGGSEGAGGGEETGTEVGEVREGDVEGFRFALAPQRLKMDIRAMNKGALVKYDKNYGDYGNMLKALESSLGATKAMANVGNGMSVWASGVYAQGRNKVMFGNPAAADKHYGIMVGTHYYHKPSRQLIGIAFDVGLGNSRANIDHKQKSAYRSAEATAYYSYGLTKKWKVNLQLAHMLIRANNHRPYGASGANTIALSNSKSSVTSGLVETDYKFKPSKTVHLRPSAGLRVGHTKQNAYTENNAGANNMHFRAATMTELALKTALKVSMFHKKDDETIYGLYPEIGFTHYLKAGRMRQKAGLINSGTLQLLESGTPGKNLLNLGLGAGITNTEANTKYQMAYTASFQKYRTSHEVMFKGSWPF